MWLVEAVFVAAPSIFFIFYARYSIYYYLLLAIIYCLSNKTKRINYQLPDEKSKDAKKYATRYIVSDQYGTIKMKNKPNLISAKIDEFETVIWTAGLRKAFIFHLLVRMIIEILFFIALFYIQTEQHHSWKVTLQLLAYFSRATKIKYRF